MISFMHILTAITILDVSISFRLVVPCDEQRGMAQFTDIFSMYFLDFNCIEYCDVGNKIVMLCNV